MFDILNPASEAFFLLLTLDFLLTKFYKTYYCSNLILTN